jgi:hypothetical protein
MKRRKAAVTVCAVVAALVFAAPATAQTFRAAADDEVTVTYKTPFFNDVVYTTVIGDYALEYDFSEVRGKIDSDKVFVADGVSIEWYADEGYSTLYDFDEELTGDTVLYGKVTDTGRYVKPNGYGWDVQSGKVYAGEAVNNNYITTDSYIPAGYTDEKGAASFSFNGTKYAVYTRGLDITKPFTVTLDFDYDPSDEESLSAMSAAWFEYSVYPSLTLAQAGGAKTWGNTGAASVLTFNLGSQVLAGLTAGTVWNNVKSTTNLTAYTDAFKALFDGGNAKIELTAEITDTGTTFSSGDVVVATSPAKRADFPSGYAYLNFGSISGKAFDVDIAVGQESGAITATVDSGATIGEVQCSGTVVTLTIDLKDGFALQSMTAGGASVAYAKVYGTKNVYALDLPVWGKDAEIKITTKEKETTSASDGNGSIAATDTAAVDTASATDTTSAAEKKGCGGEMTSLAAVMLLAVGSGLLVGKIRKKEEKR